MSDRRVSMELADPPFIQLTLQLLSSHCTQKSITDDVFYLGLISLYRAALFTFSEAIKVGTYNAQAIATLIVCRYIHGQRGELRWSKLSDSQITLHHPYPASGQCTTTSACLQEAHLGPSEFLFKEVHRYVNRFEDSNSKVLNVILFDSRNLWKRRT